MNVVAWNIRWGGGERSSDIAAVLIERHPDVIVLSEYQPAASAPLVEALRGAGWPHGVFSTPPLKYGGVAVLAKTPLTEQPAGGPMRAFHFRYLSVTVPAHDLDLRAVYAPLHHDPYADFWNAMLADLRASVQRPVLMIGDLNAGKSGIDSPSPDVFCSDFFTQLPGCGYRDLWRGLNGHAAREHTWQGRVNPYRLDHAFGSSALAGRVRACAYDHTVRERGVSDHSLLWLEID